MISTVLILDNRARFPQCHVKSIITCMWNYVKTCKEHRDGSYIIHITARIFNEVPSSLTLFLDRLYFPIVTIYFTRLWKLPAIKPLSSRYIREYNFAMYTIYIAMIILRDILLK